MTDTHLYRPPAPKPKTSVTALATAVLLGKRDMLALLPESAYNVFVGKAPIGKRPIFVVNHPKHVRHVLIDKVANYPKGDVMVDALEPLVGDGVFISGGETWAHQRRMIDPAFAHMRIKTAFGQMAEATEIFLDRLDASAANRETLVFDEEMSHLTADIIFRTIFSEPIEGAEARAVFHAFTAYQNEVPQIEPRLLMNSRAGVSIPTPPKVRKACEAIRRHLGAMIDRRVESGAQIADIAGDIIAARDPQTGEGFSREELIDQIAVFFLAGHETTASALTWAFFILSQQPDVMQKIREEVSAISGDGAITFSQTRAMTYTRNVFREVLRLYPPVSFIARTAEVDDVLGNEAIAKGSLLIMSPWLIHRHRTFWDNPDHFDPDRFSSAREKMIRPGTYLPFGLGPRVCTGASFATTEATLILAALCRRYDFNTMNPTKIEPVGKLTTRPNVPVQMRLNRA